MTDNSDEGTGVCPIRAHIRYPYTRLNLNSPFEIVKVVSVHSAAERNLALKMIGVFHEESTYLFRCGGDGRQRPGRLCCDRNANHFN